LGIELAGWVQRHHGGFDLAPLLFHPLLEFVELGTTSRQHQQCSNRRQRATSGHRFGAKRFHFFAPPGFF
jgi:hypothetical protein